MKIKLLAAAGVVTAVVGFGAAPAFAGEVNGNGDPTPVQSYRAGSICSFSGLNDHPDEPGEEGRVQNWGHVLRANTGPGFTVADAAKAKLIKEFGPGTNCRGYASQP